MSLRFNVKARIVKSFFGFYRVVFDVIDDGQECVGTLDSEAEACHVAYLLNQYQG